MRRGSRPGWCVTELLAMILILCGLLAVAVPVLGRMRGVSQIDVSISNLTVLSQASSMYAADWNGRQYTNVNDELSSYGSSPFSAVSNFQIEHGDHPPVLLGWGPSVPGTIGLWGYWMDFAGNWNLLQPTDFGNGFGMFRIVNAVPFHQYVNGRFYDPTFYAPNDASQYDGAEPAFDEPWEFVAPYDGPDLAWSSYCFSPAAMFHPAVMGANPDGRFQDPWSLPDGLTSPPLSAALYPDLKTQMLEHSWVQDPPAPCNPANAVGTGTFGACFPYYFNQGIDSAPVTLFYDGHVRLLPNQEVLIADQTVLEQSGGESGLWHRGTPMGTGGYYIEAGYDGTPLSHHILTTFGILGRDTLSSNYGVQSSARSTNTAAIFAKRHRPRPVARTPGSGFIISAGP